MNPSEQATFSGPSPLNYAWIGVGAIALIGGAIALIVGATNTETVPAAAAAMPRRIARSLSFSASPDSAGVVFRGAF